MTNALRRVKVSTWDDNGNLIERRTTMEGDGTVVAIEEREYKTIGNDDEIIRWTWWPAVDQNDDPTGDPLERTWTYYEDTDDDGYGCVRSYVSEIGFWEFVEYNEYGRVYRVIHPLGQTPYDDPANPTELTSLENNNIVEEYEYLNIDLQRIPQGTNPETYAFPAPFTTKRKTKVEGDAVSTSYTIDWPYAYEGSTREDDEWTEVWKIECVTAEPGSSDTEYLRDIVDDADNDNPIDDRLTRTYTYKYGEIVSSVDVGNKLKKVEHWDGRVTNYSYPAVDQTVTESGWPDERVKVTEEEDIAGKTVAVLTTQKVGSSTWDDISLVKTDTTSDRLGRASSQTHYFGAEASDEWNSSNGTEAYTIDWEYGCCNIETVTDRAGLNTGYVFDDLMRQTMVTEPSGVAISTDYDAADRVIKTSRIPTGQSPVTVTLAETTYDLAGRKISQRRCVDTLPDPDTYTYAYYVYGDVGEDGAEYDSGNHSQQYREVRVYPHDTNSGPILVTWYDLHGRPWRQWTASTTATWSDQSPPTWQENLTELSRTVTFYDWADRPIKVWTYHNVDSLNMDGDGTLGTNYYETTYAYDVLGRIWKTEDAAGDITINIYDDDTGQLVEQWKGTDDTGADDPDDLPTGSGSNNMVMVAKFYYDTDRDGVDEDDLVDYVTREYRAAPISSTPSTLTTDYIYTDHEQSWDDQNEQRVVSTMPQADGGPWTEQVYDYQGRLVEKLTYENDNGTEGDLLAKTAYGYDASSGNLTSQKVYDVTGSPPWNYVETTYYYEDPGEQDGEGGRLVKVATSGGGFTKTAFDTHGRVLRTVTGASEGATTDCFGQYTFTHDILLTETVYDYDDADNVIQTTTYTRNHDAGSEVTGLLSASGDARANYQVTWYDNAHRPTHVAEYGTNGGSALTDYDPETAGTQTYDDGPIEPDSSDDVIVTMTEYDDAGYPSIQTDNADTETHYEYDAFGRTTKVTENYEDPGAPDDDYPDQNRVTAYTYNAANQVVTQTADLEGTGNDQTTLYVYSGDLTDKGCPVKTNALLRAIIYPDSDDVVSSEALANGTDTDYDRVELTYYADGSMATRADQRGTVLTYTYTDSGRRESQRITTLGDDTDNTIRSITYGYDVLNRLAKVTSHGDATSDPDDANDVENQVVYEYDGLGRLETEYQEHDGVKDGNTHAMTFDYDDTVSSYELTKGGRLASVTYPNGRTVHWVYDGHSGIDDAIGRANELAEDDGTGDPGSTIVEYSYLGSGVAVVKDYPNSDVKLSYAEGTGGDPYDSGGGGGLDRFGRVVSHVWKYYSGGGGDLIDISYAYDHASNRLYADRGVYKSHSEEYTYDNLHRLVAYNHGNSDGAGEVQDYWKAQLANWTLDTLGNQLEVGTKEDTTDYFTNTPNDANEYTARETQGLGQAITFLDVFSSDTSANYDVAGTDTMDVNSTNAGSLTVTNLVDDTGDDEAAAIILLGDGTSDVETGPVYMAMLTKFPSGAGSGQSGFVFGYQSANSYWLLVNDLGDDTCKLYQVINGSKTLKASTSNAGLTADTWEVLVLSSRRGALEKTVPYDFPDGFPTGRIGLWTNCDETQFDLIMLIDNAYKSDMLGRLANYSNANATNGGLTLFGDMGDYEQPTLLQGIRSKRFQVVFSVEAGQAYLTGYDVDFVFNSRDVDDFDFIRIYFASTATAPLGYKVVNGLKASTVSHTTRDAGNMPDLSSGGTLWVRITSDGTTVKVQAQENGTEPTWGDLSGSPNDLVYVSSNFDFTTSGGGQMGFKSGQNRNSLVDNVIVKTDRTANGEYETTDLEETFTTSGGYAQETPTHDAAGNLTYDGVFSYVYDAWNRLVTVTKAYRDPTSGDIEEGSDISTSEYDGNGRRIIKAVANSGDLDCTYHYYFRGQSIIEERNGSDYVMKHYVWAPDNGYIDELVQMSIAKSTYANPAHSGGAGVGWARHFYALHNANYNVMMLVEALPSGGHRIVERYEYTPYGQRMVYSHGYLTADANRNGVVDDDDDDILAAQWNQTAPNLTGDIDGNGQVNSSDADILDIEYEMSVEYLNDPLVMYASGGGSYYDPAFKLPMNEVGHQGLFHDEESELVYNRARILHPRLGRFVQRDQLEYEDGVNFYVYLQSVPISGVDPLGLAAKKSAKCIKAAQKMKEICSQAERACAVSAHWESNLSKCTSDAIASGKCCPGKASIYQARKICCPTEYDHWESMEDFCRKKTKDCSVASLKALKACGKP